MRVIHSKGRKSNGPVAQRGKKESRVCPRSDRFGNEQGVIRAVVKIEQLQILRRLTRVNIGARRSTAGASAFQIGKTLSFGPPHSYFGGRPG